MGYTRYSNCPTCACILSAASGRLAARQNGLICAPELTSIELSPTVCLCITVLEMNIRFCREPGDDD